MTTDNMAAGAAGAADDPATAPATARRRTAAAGETTECAFDRVRMMKCTYVDDDTCSDDGYDWEVDVQVVRNPAAATGAYAVGDVERLVQGYHGALLGCNTGWDRYLDDHLGVWCEAPFKLDSAGPKLCEAGVGFHAHSGSGGSRVGSLWTAGAGNVAVELRGEFDYRFFNESALGMLDYCAKDSSGHCEPGRC